MRIIRFSLLSLLLLTVYAVKSNGNTLSDTLKLIHSGKVIEEAKALTAEEQYVLAEAKLLSIPASDTNYVLMQVALMDMYIEQEAYDRAIGVGEVALIDKSAHKAELYATLGTAYEKNEQGDKAIEVYRAGLKQFPYDHYLHYLLGYSLLNQEVYDEAIEEFKASIRINPFFSNSHLYLGNIMIMKGQRSRAMMCLGTYMALSPTNNAALVFYNNLLQSAVSIEGSQAEEEPDAALAQLDVIIRSNAALDSKFKSSIALKAPAAQQTELLLESLSPVSRSDDFWMEFYVPMFTKIQADGLSQAFIYHILSSVDDKSVKKWLKSNEKESERFYALANEYLRAFRASQTTTVGGKNATYSFWFYDNNRLDAIGNQIDDDTFIGPWQFYYPNGVLKAEGVFLDNGNKTASWKYYYDDGSLKKTEEYDAEGEIQGYVINYYENGKIENEIPYKQSLIDGIVKIYYPCGQLKESLQYKEDQRHGNGNQFFESGEILSSYTYENGIAVGAFIYYYPNGQKKEVYTYTDGKMEGAYESYYANGQLFQKGQYKDEEPQGEWIGYHEDGTLKFTGNFENGFRAGSWKNYHLNGELLSEELYDEEGNLNGTARYYTEKGQEHYNFEYTNGKLTAYAYFDKDKNILSEGSNSKGNFKMKGYYPDGVLSFEGLYRNGQMHGKFTYYYHNGLTSTIINLVDGSYEGPAEYFYESGRKKIVTHFTNDKEHGFYQSFHQNGQLNMQGWMVNGSQEQYWLSYLPDGTLIRKTYYMNGEIHGDFEEFDHYGRRLMSSKYYQGLVTHKIQFDTLGTVLKSDAFDMGSGTFVVPYASNKVRHETVLQCGENTTEINTYFADGKLYGKTPVKHGLYNGRYQAFYANRKPRVEGDYLDNEREGLWTWYFESGAIDSKIHYKAGQANGERTDYYENGQIRTIGNFKEGERFGSTLFYAPDGSLQIEKVYDEYGLQSFRYLNEHNEFTPFESLKNGTGKVVAYYPNGKVSIEQQYQHGLLNGIQSAYYPSGQVLKKQEIELGASNGKLEEFFENGQLKLLSTYENGDLHGVEMEYFNNGKIRRKTTYVFGEKEGWEEIYNQQGELVSKEYYRDGYTY